jgi:hypothetical protein
MPAEYLAFEQDLAETSTPRKIVTASGGGEVVEGLELVSEEGKKRVLRTALDGLALLKALEVFAPDRFTVENESMEKYFWQLYGKGENR